MASRDLTMIEKLYPLLILTGSVLLLVTLYYNKILKNLIEVLTNLLELQENRENDVESYIYAIEQKLLSIGIKKISYDIKYLNKHIILNHVNPKGIILKKDIYYKNITGTLFLEVNKNTGEYKVINKLILYILALQIVNAIHTDIEKINESFERIAKLQTYMIHDLKNILQFFQLMQHNVTNLNTQEEKEKFIDFLQNSTQPINTKVNKILALLQIESKAQQHQHKESIDIEKFLTPYLQQYNLPCNITKNALSIYADKESLQSIFDNILSNIHYKNAHEPNLICSIEITEKEDSVEIIISDNGKPFENPQSVSQPFYTTKENGLGIGMYQVHTLMELQGGSIQCRNIHNRATMILSFPKV